MTSPTGPSTTAPPPDPRRWWALGALVTALLVLGFDTTILNVALPTLAAQLGAGTGRQQWIADAYAVVFAGLMLPAGLLGDRFGRRRMLLCGLGIFLAGSLLGTLADSAPLVIGARAVMGTGAALIMPLAMSVLPSLFGPGERSTAVGAVSAASALGLPLGPLVGGWLLDHFWWGSVFLVNVPLVLIGIAACVFLLPETSDPAAPPVDVRSALLTVTGLGALILGIIEGPARGWRDSLVLTSLAASVVLIAALVLRGRGQARPMLDLRLLRSRGFLWNTVAAALGTLVLSGLMFLLPQYLQAVLGYDAFGTGLRMLPMMGGLLLAAKGSGALAARFGPRPVVTGGLAVLACAAFLGATTDVHDGYGATARWLSLAGVGFGFAMVPAMDAALGALPADRAGNGSGLLMTVRQIGGALGVAVLGSLLAGAYGDRIDTAGLPPRAADAAGDSVVAAHLVAERLGVHRLAASADRAYLHGMALALVVCGGAALVAGVLTAVFLPDPRGGSGNGGSSGPGRRSGTTGGRSGRGRRSRSRTPGARSGRGRQADTADHPGTMGHPRTGTTMATGTSHARE
ncbi:DHA2 family efflux MFS transporter permease subunit [Streptomyces gilvosporeus]|uniref:MFS transporter n=1 Tax=Streptomyces gilvosporeus TaxID=553510 RepID=A0A1V0U3R1_9ACTN|nr:DHA2 family efflux MFS transporter permease subunit [Streptomyces gilvosporeus]ARF59710.1 MFS transporter [Streptomyces gilvosporeus]